MNLVNVSTLQTATIPTDVGRNNIQETCCNQCTYNVYISINKEFNKNLSKPYEVFFVL